MENIALRPTTKDEAIIEAVARAIAADIKGADDNIEHAATDIAKVLTHHPYGDGYELAKYLEDECGWFNVGFQTAEKLDSARGMLYSKVRECTEEWVKRNAIKPKATFGDKVMVTERGKAIIPEGVKSYEGQIVEINEKLAEYTVMVPALGHVRDGIGTHGFMVPFEHVHELAAPPEEFALMAQ